MLSDIDYFRKRLAEELALAASADTEEVHRVHKKLAELYSGRLSTFAADAGRVVPLVEPTRPANTA